MVGLRLHIPSNDFLKSWHARGMNSADVESTLHQDSELQDECCVAPSGSESNLFLRDYLFSLVLELSPLKIIFIIVYSANC